VLYATAAAAAGTRIEVQSPATAALFYTTWAKWGGAMTAKTVVTGARPEVTVGGCGSSTVMFPGGIVVKGPSCVTLRVTSGEGSWYKTVHVPVGRSC